MPLRGSLESLARRPKDTEGPAAIAQNASRLIFWISLISAATAFFVFPFPVSQFVVCISALGVIGSFLLALLATGNVPLARRTVQLQLPFAVAGVIYLIVMFAKFGHLT